MTIQAELIGGLSELRRISGAMHIMAVETGYPAPIHNAFDEIVALHAVFMRRAVRVVKEVGRRAERPFLQFPMLLKLRPNVIADGPIVVFALDGIRKRLPLGVALNAGVAGRHVIHMSRILNVVARGMRRVFTTWAMATFTADVPLGDLLGVNIVTDRMTTVAKRARGAMHIVRRIKGRPPIAACRRHCILAPFVVLNFPLHRQREIVLTDFCEITLLPNAAVDERDLVL